MSQERASWKVRVDGRFTPDSDEADRNQLLRLSAKNGPEHPQQDMFVEGSYSITIGTREQRRRNCQAERLRDLGVEHELDFGWLLDGHIPRERAVKYLSICVAAIRKGSTLLTP